MRELIFQTLNMFCISLTYLIFKIKLYTAGRRLFDSDIRTQIFLDFGWMDFYQHDFFLMHIALFKVISILKSTGIYAPLFQRGKYGVYAGPLLTRPSRREASTTGLEKKLCSSVCLSVCGRQSLRSGMSGPSSLL